MHIGNKNNLLSTGFLLEFVTPRQADSSRLMLAFYDGLHELQLQNPTRNIQFI